MAIERNLPENRQRFLDAQAAHWDDVVRRIGSALGFVKSAQAEFLSSPQKNEQWLTDKFEELICCLDSRLASARQTQMAAIEFADDEAARL